MEYTLEKDNDTSTLTLTGDLGIEQASKLKQTLMESFETFKQVRVNLGDVSKMDITCIQVFCAANKSCEKKQIRLLKVNTAGHITSTLSLLGYDHHKENALAPCSNCFWKGETNHE